MITRANTPTLVGAFAVAQEGVRRRLILCDKIMRIELDEALLPEYVALVGQTSSVRSVLSGAGTGTSQSMVNIRGSDVRDLGIVVRPRREQVAIVAAREAQVAATRSVSALLFRQIHSFVELKRSLITAAVTGEFDVSTADGSRIPC
jgi:type I restriction enzyme S subunit